MMRDTRSKLYLSGIEIGGSRGLGGGLIDSKLYLSGIEIPYNLCSCTGR